MYLVKKLLQKLFEIKRIMKRGLCGGGGVFALASAQSQEG